MQVIGLVKAAKKDAPVADSFEIPVCAIGWFSLIINISRGTGFVKPGIGIPAIPTELQVTPIRIPIPTPGSWQI